MFPTFEQRLSAFPPPSAFNSNPMLNQALAPKLKGLELPTALPRDKKQTPPAKIAFPYKLYKLLDDAERAGIHSSIISWLPDGSGFKIHDAKAFSDTVMSSYFNQSKYKSFTRQLYLYGFLKLSSGPNEGVFYHPTFVRGNRESCLAIRRNQFVGDRRHAKKGTTKNSNLGNKISSVKKTKRQISASSSHADEAASSSNIASEKLPLRTTKAPKAALTLFDEVFNLIDDDTLTTTQSQYQQQQHHQPLRYPPSSRAPSRTTPNYGYMTPTMMELHHHEQQTPTPVISESNSLHDFTFASSSHVNSLSDSIGNHQKQEGLNDIRLDCFPSSNIPTSRTTTLSTDSVDLDDWLQKVSTTFTEEGLDVAHDNVVMDDLLDFMPRPIEEMLQLQR